MTIWPDGTYRLSNMWLGDVQMLGVGSDAFGNSIPIMNAAQNGSHWSFNLNAGTSDAPNVAMLTSVSLETVRAFPQGA
jgi:hypothetical protein